MTDVPPAQDPPPAHDGPEAWLKPFLRFLAREWPYLVILVLSLFGVAYTSITRTPMTLYWFVARALHRHRLRGDAMVRDARP